jgi:hypothetical protein
MRVQVNLSEGDDEVLQSETITSLEELKEDTLMVRKRIEPEPPLVPQVGDKVTPERSDST